MQVSHAPFRISPVSFRYNNLDSVKELFTKYPNQIACVIMEPATSQEPHQDFLSRVKQLCEDHWQPFYSR